jgi:hypothetical protein
MALPTNGSMPVVRQTVIPNQVLLMIRHRGSISEGQIDALIASINAALRQSNPSLSATLSRVQPGGGDDFGKRTVGVAQAGDGAALPVLTFQHRRAGFSVVLLNAGLPDDNPRRLADAVRAINALGARQTGDQTGVRTVGRRRTQADDALVGLLYRLLDSLQGERDDQPMGDEGLQGPAFSASPNRLQSASHHGGGFGGPGTWPIQPTPVNADFLHHALTHGLRHQLSPANGARQPVTVAVLDTWLSAGEVAQALSANWARSLLEPGSGVSFVNYLRLSPAERALLAAQRAAEPDAHPYLMRSHGLFAVSQIRRLAPEDIPVMVYEALDEYGMGTGFHILQILWHLADTYRPSNLVVNLSLTVRPLPNSAPTILPDGTSGLDLAPLEWGDPEPFDPLRAVCRLLTLEGAVLVAAAGNDSFDLSPSVPPKPTAAPARFPSVIAVGAVEPGPDGSFTRARYSNLSGRPSPGDPTRRTGFMAIGGGVSNANQPPPEPVDGLLPTPDVSGAFIDSEYPTGTIAAPSPGANTSGVVYWGGTSFATAKVTGLVAALLAAGHVRPTSGCGCWPFATLISQQTTKEAVVNVLHRRFVRRVTAGFNEPILEV